MFLFLYVGPLKKALATQILSCYLFTAIFPSKTGIHWASMTASAVNLSKFVSGGSIQANSQSSGAVTLY